MITEWWWGWWWRTEGGTSCLWMVMIVMVVIVMKRILMRVIMMIPFKRRNWSWWGGVRGLHQNWRRHFGGDWGDGRWQRWDAMHSHASRKCATHQRWFHLPPVNKWCLPKILAEKWWLKSGHFDSVRSSHQQYLSAPSFLVLASVCRPVWLTFVLGNTVHGQQVRKGSWR